MIIMLFILLVKNLRSIHLLVKRVTAETLGGSQGGTINLTGAIKESEKVSPILKRDLIGVARPKGKGLAF